MLENDFITNTIIAKGGRGSTRHLMMSPEWMKHKKGGTVTQAGTASNCAPGNTM